MKKVFEIITTGNFKFGHIFLQRLLRACFESDNITVFDLTELPPPESKELTYEQKKEIIDKYLNEHELYLITKELRDQLAISKKGEIKDRILGIKPTEEWCECGGKGIKEDPFKDGQQRKCCICGKLIKSIKPQPEYCECNTSARNPLSGCPHCGKPIKHGSEIEELDMDINAYGAKFYWLAKKLNELLRLLKSKGVIK